MRFLCYTDVHTANVYNFNKKKDKFTLSEYSRVDELYSSLSWVARIAKETSTDMCINLGDTFHQALRYYVERFNATHKLINSIHDNCTSKTGVIIKGNHDENNEICAIDTFEQFPNTILVKNSVKTKYISEINSWLIFVPYIRDSEKVKEVFQKLYDRFHNVGCNVYVFCHLDVREAYGGTIKSTFQLNQINSYDDLHLGSFTAVFSGHIHSRIAVKDNLFYIGALLNHSFSDSISRKGACLIDITPEGYKLNFIDNPYCPIFISIDLSNEIDAKKKLDYLYEQSNKYTFTNIYATIYSLSNADGKAVADEFVKNHYNLFTSFEIKYIESEQEIKEYIEAAKNVDSINVIDMIIEQGRISLTNQGLSDDSIEEYITKFKKLCVVN